jgi:nucleoside-diphosphate-sugar epimerase
MTASRSVLITGAGGFVCGSITRVLLERRWQVTAVDRQFDETTRQSLQAQWGDQIRFLVTDSNHLPDISVDSLVHGAAITASPEELGQSAEDNFRSNIEPMLAVSEWANEHKVKRTLLISSSAVYAATDPGAVSETQPTSPSGLYAVAKQTTESLVNTLHDVYGRDVATIRLSNIYGPDEQARPTRPRISLVGQMVQQALQTGKITVYQNDPTRDWTFAPDIGAAVDSLLSQPVLHHSLYNVASEQILSPIDIAETIHAVMPNITVDVRSGTNPNVPKLTRLGYLSHQRLQDETGFTGWTSFEKGLQQVIAERTEKEMNL